MNKIGRNDPCSCGSGKKYKHCCYPKNVGGHVTSPQSQAADPLQMQKLSLAFANLNSGRIKDAINLCNAVLSKNKDNHIALNLLGIIYHQSGDNTAAIRCLTQSLKIKPDYPDANNNLGVVYRDEAKHLESAVYFHKAIESKSNYLEAYINLGNALQDLRQLNQAIELYRKALAINPEHPGLLSNLANALQEANRHHEAIECFDRILRSSPDFEFAMCSRLYSKLYCCDWDDFDKLTSDLLEKVHQAKTLCKPFEFLAISDDPELQLKVSSNFAAHKYPSQPRLNQKQSIHSDKIRIAYISADFKQHPVAQLLVGLIENHDRNLFEVYGISLTDKDDTILGIRIAKAFDEFIPARNKSDLEIAKLMSSMGIDIAIDLMGYTTNARMGIFSYQAAPIQISFLGFAATTGTDYIQYLIADSQVIPHKNEPYYSEKIIRLPHCFQPNDTAREISTTPLHRKDFNLPEDGFVFCAFNNHFKIQPKLFDVWARILLATPGSVLWLSKAANPVKSNLIKEAEKRGLNPERIVFAERVPALADHLARHQLADLYLDTSPYNAHTTASDALWAGLPVLTCEGKSYVSRVASSLLHTLGLPELITHDLREYERLAIDLAGKNSQRLESLRQKLIINKASSPLFNTKQYAKDFEHCLMELMNKCAEKSRTD
jgi:Predicted O-linked N-acetylglucosamine transferase, SPINDLY family